MSYFPDPGNTAKSRAREADMQIDSLDTTSPIRGGTDSAGAAPLEGPKEFSSERTRMRRPGETKTTRRGLLPKS